jgi:hypothetical protein
MGWDDASESAFLNRQSIVDRRIHAAMDGRQTGGKRERRLETSSFARATDAPRRSALGKTRLTKPS